MTCLPETYYMQTMFLSQAQSLMTIFWLNKEIKVIGVGKTLVSTHFFKFSNLQVGTVKKTLKTFRVNTLIYVQLNSML